MTMQVPALSPQCTSRKASGDQAILPPECLRPALQVPALFRQSVA